MTYNSNSANNPNPQLKPNFDEILKIHKFTNINPSKQVHVHGFLVKSTAPINVEEPNDTKIDLNVLEDSKIKISDIAEILRDAEAPEVIVRIHGYGTKEKDAIKQYYQTIDEINCDKQLQDIGKTFVFLGYRWPSESPDIKGFFTSITSICDIFNALPTLPHSIFVASLIGIVFFIVMLLFQTFDNIPIIFLLFGFGLFGLLLSITFTLILLRISAYFRDSFRATNYGVPDLVELIRELDEAIKRDPHKPRIKLSFIAHSMGCYVTTNTIRILSDVFSSSDKPDSEIGTSFTLGRLILVAPDIPVEAIKPRRANFLQASLKRFEESYIFSNEGDVVLRIASTAANYFSFPAKTRSSGYRLGNITVSHDQNSQKITYGIINNSCPIISPYELLEVRSSDKHIMPVKEGNENIDTKICKAVTNKFTYFDCTYYTEDRKKKKKGEQVNFVRILVLCTSVVAENKLSILYWYIYFAALTCSQKKVTPVSLALNKKVLNFWDYFCLVWTDLSSPDTNTHGGYFQGAFTKDLIYKLAFLGFDGLLDSYSSENDSDKERRDKFSEECEDRQIRVLLSPERWKKYGTLKSS